MHNIEAYPQGENLLAANPQLTLLFAGAARANNAIGGRTDDLPASEAGNETAPLLRMKKGQPLS
jgi:hypothetical protein